MKGLEKDAAKRWEHATALASAVRDGYLRAGLVREPSRSFDATADFSAPSPSDAKASRSRRS